MGAMPAARDDTTRRSGGPEALRPSTLVAARLRPLLAPVQRRCRSHALGTRGSGIHGVRGYHRPAPAGRPVYDPGGIPCLRDPRDLSPSLGGTNLGDGGASRLIRCLGDGRLRWSEFVRSRDVPGLRVGLRAGGRSGLPQDLTVFNVTKEAMVSRQAQVAGQLPPIPGTQRAAFAPTLPAPPDWWAEARIPLE
jgi:hypothetical protein